MLRKGKCELQFVTLARPPWPHDASAVCVLSGVVPMERYSVQHVHYCTALCSWTRVLVLFIYKSACTC